jgi:hypothetical protein
MADSLGTSLDVHTGAALIGGITAARIINGGVVSGPGPGLSVLELSVAAVVATQVMTLFSGIQHPGAFATSFALGMPAAVTSVLSSSAGRFEAGSHIDLVAKGIPVEHASLIRELIELLQSEARRQSIRSISIHVSRFDDPEEGDSESVVTQKVDASADHALAYWDEVGRTIQSWTATLGDEEARFVLGRVAVNVDWTNGDDSTVRPG